MKKKRMLPLLAICIMLFAGSGPVPDNGLGAVCAGIAAANPSVKVIGGSDSWYFLRSELVHLAAGQFWGAAAGKVSRAQKPDEADPLPAIIDLNNQLKKKGIELIFLPVPAKAMLYPEKLDKSVTLKDNTRIDSLHQEFYRLLRDNGVQVLDIMPQLVAKRNGNDPVYCRTDAHWSALACEIAAAEAAKLIRTKRWYKTIAKQEYVTKTQDISVSGDLVNRQDNPPKETIHLRLVTDRNGQYVSATEDSPVVLMGDSHTLVFHEGGDMLAKGAGLADQLAFELGFAPDLIGVRGSGSTASRINLFRKSKTNPEYLSGKKTVIWCITVREFSESTGGWKKVPVSP
ncbi:MAG: hypothetical protein JW874_04000 [Spirochaetales bacterium]|nr:hypothetical protein [Spirochaetales bacterium]